MRSSLSPAVDVLHAKRQAVASSSCAMRENTWGICSPANGEMWYNGTFNEFTWKYNNALYVNAITVDLYLLYLNNTQYTTIKVWAGLPNAQGVLVNQVDDSWFPSLLPDNSPNKSWAMTVYMLGSGANLQAELAKIPTKETLYPLPTNFTLIQNAHTTPSVDTAQPTSHDINATHLTTSPATSSDASPALKPWAIAVICVSSFIFLAAIAAAVWAVRKIKRGKHRPMAETVRSFAPEPHQGTPALKTFAETGSPGGDSRDMASIYSSTPMLQGTNVKHPPHFASPIFRDLQGEKKLSHLLQPPDQPVSSSILSSTDALMIADTFRQFMRKPEWNEHSEEEPFQEKAQDAKIKKNRSSNLHMLHQAQVQDSTDMLEDPLKAGSKMP
ncbi:hypothetical protein BDF14DRAFT_1884373 [Spinellus fusiger]|nr:hypothetical protein BDF14DRAFT_1884373 [Spinellus fusiger]